MGTVVNLKEVEHQTQSTVSYRLYITHSSCNCRLGSINPLLTTLGCRNIRMENKNGKTYWSFDFGGDFSIISNNLNQGGFVYNVVT